MDSAIQEICERADINSRDVLIRQVKMLEKIVRVASYTPQKPSFPEKENSQTEKNTNGNGDRQQRKERREKIISYLENHPGANVKEIAQMLDLESATTGIILKGIEKMLDYEFEFENHLLIKKYFVRYN